MEGKIERVNPHNHPVILKKDYHAEGQHCYHCKQAVICRTSVYTCAKYCETFWGYVLHKKCVEFFVTFMHPSHKHPLHLVPVSDRISKENCSVCNNDIQQYFRGYQCDLCEFYLCLRCAVTPQGRTIQHWSHQHSSLHLVEKCATFECDACETVAADYSYRCDDVTCPFWIHFECATLPRVKLFGIHHKHPLQMSDSLPQAYRQFAFKCKICRSFIHTDQWIFYCANCRFFAHIRCALQTTPVYRHITDHNQPKLSHLPSPDVSSMNLMIQKLLKDMISLSMDIHVAPPDHINHWAHAQHPLALINTNVAVIVDDELKQVSESWRICNGCIKPISSGDDVFYECNECNYFLHRYCAQFPQEIQHQHLGMLKGFQPNIFPDGLQRCESCGVFSNGFMFMSKSGKLLDVQCVTLPQKFIYDGDNHHLFVQYDISTLNFSPPCRACGNSLSAGDLVYSCENCFTYLHWRCALWPSTINKWDPHPLHLVFSVENDVEDHPHDFECEFCSQVIDTNAWFYHCKICDLSLHFRPGCIDPYHLYSNVKFGATNVKIKAHDHSMTFLLNKKKRPPCGSCREDTRGQPILECKSCNFVRHAKELCCEE